MLELILGNSFTTIISGPDNLTSPNAVLYLNGAQASASLSVTQLGSTNVWSISFVPNSTGIYTVYAFGQVQFRAQANTKSIYASLANIEDYTLGNWMWNKQTGLLTLYRVNGSVLATYNMLDQSNSSSREKLT